MNQVSDATRILGELAAGDSDAAQRLMPLVYQQLRALAGACFRGQSPAHTLQPTVLVHEAFLRLVDRDADGPQRGYRDRAHFMAVAAVAMRQILTDHARRVRAAKRGGGVRRVDVDVAIEDGSAAAPGAGGRDGATRLDVLALDEALRELATLDPRRHRVVELRFFGGLSIQEVAEVTGLSTRTVESDWRAARAWIGARLGAEPPAGAAPA